MIVDVVVVELATASGEEINHKSCDLLRAGSNDLVIKKVRSRKYKTFGSTLLGKD